MTWQVLATLALVATMGTAVVLTRDPHRQLFAIVGSGMALTLLFLTLEAPDVAISEIGVGTVIVPLLFLVALTAIGSEDERRRRDRGNGDGGNGGGGGDAA